MFRVCEERTTTLPKRLDICMERTSVFQSSRLLRDETMPSVGEHRIEKRLYNVYNYLTKRIHVYIQTAPLSQLICYV